MALLRETNNKALLRPDFCWGTLGEGRLTSHNTNFSNAIVQDRWHIQMPRGSKTKGPCSPKTICLCQPYFSIQKQKWRNDFVDSRILSLKTVLSLG